MQRMDLAKLLDKHIPAHGNRKGLLYIGDSKMAALQMRASIQFHEDFDLIPSFTSTNDIRLVAAMNYPAAS